MMKYIKVTDTDIFEDRGTKDYSFMVGIEEDKYQSLKEELEQIIDNLEDYEGDSFDAMESVINTYNGIIIKPSCELRW